MKICRKCGFENSDTCTLCEKCFSGDLELSQETDTEEFFKNEECREKRSKILNLLLIPIYYIICIPLYAMCVRADRECAFYLLIPLAFPLIFYLMNQKAQALFDFHKIFQLDVANPESMEPSDWYFLSSKISSYIVLLLGIFCIVRIYMHLH